MGGRGGRARGKVSMAFPDSLSLSRGGPLKDFTFEKELRDFYWSKHFLFPFIKELC